MRYALSIQGTRKIEKDFARFGERVQDLRPIWPDVLQVIYEIEEQAFETEGRSTGGKWRKLTPAWAGQKQDEGLDPHVGQSTQLLRNAITGHSPGHLNVQERRKDLTVSVNLPYAGIQQRQRPFVRFTDRDRREIRDVLSDYLMSVWDKSRTRRRRYG